MYERQFYVWMQEQGYAVDLLVSEDLHDRGRAALDDYRLSAFIGHDECARLDARASMPHGTRSSYQYPLL